MDIVSISTKASRESGEKFTLSKEQTIEDKTPYRSPQCGRLTINIYQLITTFHIVQRISKGVIFKREDQKSYDYEVQESQFYSDYKLMESAPECGQNCQSKVSYNGMVTLEAENASITLPSDISESEDKITTYGINRPLSKNGLGKEVISVTELPIETPKFLNLTTKDAKVVRYGPVGAISDGIENFSGKEFHYNIQNNVFKIINPPMEVLTALSEINEAPSELLFAVKDDKLSIQKAKSIHKKSDEFLEIVKKTEKEVEKKTEKIEASELQISRNELLLKDLIHRGNEYYSNGKYDNAEQYYNKALELDPINIIALMNLSFLYSENLYNYDKSLAISRRLLEIEPGLETKSNFIEDLIQVERYKEARKYALEVLNTPEDQNIVYKRESPLLNISTLDYTGYQIVNRLFVVCSYLLDDDTINGNNELVKFIDYYRNLNQDFKIEEKQWVFKGLKNAIYNSHANFQVKFVLFTLIDLLEGKITRNKLSAILYL